MPRSRGEIIAAAQQATTAAVARGALTEDRARHWQTRAEAGEDVAATVDQLAAVLPPRQVAAAMIHAPAGSDPVLFAANPLLSETRKTKPALVAAAQAEGPPPELFGDRDLPLFTASGLDPSTLARHPWPLRRPMAAAPTLAAAYQLADKYSGPGGPEMAHADHAHGPANAGYVQDFSNWLAGRATGYPTGGNANPPQVGASAPQPDYDIESLHRELFADHLPEPRKPPGVPKKT